MIFTGTGELPAGILQTAMYGVAIGVLYSEPRVRLLLDNTIRPIYEAHGLLRVAFPKIETAPAKDVDGITVTVQVTPGPAYKLDRVSFVGADYSRSEWKDLSKLKTNQTVNFDDVKAAQERIRSESAAQGHLDASSKVNARCERYRAHGGDRVSNRSRAALHARQSWISSVWIS